MNINPPTNEADAISNIKNIAIAIAGSGVTRSQDQRHVGFFLKDEGNKINFLHLGWHNTLALDSFPDNLYCYLCVSSKLDIDTVELFSDWLLELWNVNGSSVPYSTLYKWGESYFADKTYSKNESGAGLTCATFVLECFKSYGIEIVDFDSWPSRPEDSMWQKNIFSLMRKFNVPEQHIESQDILMEARFRPEEVAYAASSYDSVNPIVFNDAESHGQDIVKQMKQFGCL